MFQIHQAIHVKGDCVFPVCCPSPIESVNVVVVAVVVLPDTLLR